MPSKLTFSIGSDETNKISVLDSQSANENNPEVDVTNAEQIEGKIRKTIKGKKDHNSEIQPVDSDQHVMFLLGEHGEEDSRITPAFVELDELWSDPSLSHPPEWREVARWIKFEEEVEEKADRWSKPHVAIQSLMSVFEVRSCLAKAVMLLDLEATNLESIADVIVNRLVRKKHLSPDLMEQTRSLLLLHHSNLYSRQKRHPKTGVQQLHLIRSLAEIGKRNSSKDVHKMPSVPSHSIIKSATNLGVDQMDPAAMASSNCEGNAHDSTPSPENEPNCPQPYDHHFFKKVPHGAEAVNILVGGTDFLPHPIAAFVRLKEAVILGDMTEVPVPTRFLFILLGTAANGSKYQQIGRATGTLFSDDMFHDFALRSTSRNDLLAGIDEFLSAASLLPPAQWDPKSRIDPPPAIPSQESRKLTNLPAGIAGQPEKDVSSYQHQHHLNRTGIDLPALHINENDHRAVSNSDSLRTGDSNLKQTSSDPAYVEFGGGSKSSVEEMDRDHDPALMRTGRIFGGLVLDIKRRAPYFLSDITDAIHIQCFASFFFLYFACLTPIITFGGLLSQVTGGYLGTMESIVSGAVVGILYSLFSGQPLTIMGSTGPVLVFEGIIFRLCTGYRWAYLSFRFWIGMWTSFLLLIMVAFDLSALVRFITRFTEESFALLIALIFIYEAFKKTLAISQSYPVNYHWSPSQFPPLDCRCIPPENITNQQNLDQARERDPLLDLHFIGTNETDANHPLNNNSIIDWDRLSSDFYSWDSIATQKRCKILNGVWSNEACKGFYAPDIFFFCCLLSILCFLLSFMMRSMRNSRLFPNKVRSLIADFSVMIAIVICTSLDYFLGLHTPKLMVPDSFEPTLGFGKRGWIIPPFNGNPWWSSLAAFGPALLAVILIFMDQQITTVIINRRENKLLKGAGYHLDLLIVSITIATNSVLGIPWFVAATVLSINHVQSLKRESESAAPGERPVFLGCREQRMTGFLIFLFIGLSVFMSNILCRIPMAVLYGVFLLMGLTSVNGLQFIQRIGILFMPVKYQPDYSYLRHVRLWRVHLFTFIQVCCLALLWVIKSIQQVSILFPLMVLAMCFIRKALDFVFTQHELKCLDDILPDSGCSRKHKKNAITESGSRLTIESLPMTEPLLLNVNDKPFSVSEEVSKTLIWRQLSGIGLVAQGDDDDELKKYRRHRKKTNRFKEDDGGDSCGKEKRHASYGKRFRSLRIFSAIDADGHLAQELGAHFNQNESDVAHTTDDGGVSISSPSHGLTSTHHHTNVRNLTAPEIHINPPSNQCSPTSTRKNFKSSNPD